ENGLLPKKPTFADSGEGCTPLITACRRASISFSFFWAALPHSRNTTGRGRLFTARIAASVKGSQPFPACEFGSPVRTVRHAFKRRTPRCAQAVRQPCEGGSIPRSS